MNAPLSPTPLTNDTRPLDFLVAAATDAVERVTELERALAERKLERDAAETRAVMWETGAKELQARVAERDARIALVEGDLKNSHACWDAACHDIDLRDEKIAALEARNAALVRALKAAPCGQDGFDNPTWDCGEAHCLRCAALSTAQKGEEK